MIKINGNFKAGETGVPVTPSAPTDGTSSTSQTQAELKKALNEVEVYKEENAQWMTDDDLRELNRLEVSMKAEAALIASGGVGPGADGPELPRELEPEWNGVGPVNQMDADKRRVEENADEFGEYAGTVIIPNSGSRNDPTAGAFQMTDDMSELKARSSGRDIILTAVYQDGSKKSWVLKDGSVRSDLIVLSARGLSHGVTMDTSKVFRTVSSRGGSSGIFSGFYITGSEYDDVIKGSQNADKIVGLAGNDTISGYAGMDAIWGDEEYERAGDSDYDYGGDDTIDGGADEDTIYAGGGSDTVAKADLEGAFEWELESGSANTSPPDSFYEGFESDTWEVGDEMEAGATVVRNTGDSGGTIDLAMPEGYTMASGEKRGSDLIVTFVGDDGSFKLKFKDFFGFFGNDPKDAIVRLNLHGGPESDIIDFSKVETTSQIINITDENGGDNVVLGAKNALLADGVDINNVTESQGEGKRKLDEIVEGDGIFAPPYDDEDSDGPAVNGGYRAEAGDGQIEISRGPGERNEVLTLAAPQGYDNAYLAEDSDNYYVIMVKPGAEGGSADTIVVKINKDLVSANQIDVKMKTGRGESDDDSNWAPVENGLVPISLDESDYILDGGSGKDLLFAESGTRVLDSDEVTYYDDSATPAAASSERAGGSEGADGADESGDAGDSGDGEGSGSGSGSGDGEGE